MSKILKLLLGLDKAADGLLSPARDVTGDPDDLTISAMLGALVMWSGTPPATRARALFWLDRVDGFFLFMFGQHCHCANTAFEEIGTLRIEVRNEIALKLRNYLTTARSCNLRTSL